MFCSVKVNIFFAKGSLQAVRVFCRAGVAAETIRSARERCATQQRRVLDVITTRGDEFL